MLTWQMLMNVGVANVQPDWNVLDKISTENGGRRCLGWAQADLRRCIDDETKKSDRQSVMIDGGSQSTEGRDRLRQVSIEDRLQR